MIHPNKSVLINKLRCLRVWEHAHLPTYGSEAGYALLMELACLETSKEVNLKSIYLSIPYAESTLRLLIRNLEDDGYIVMPKDQQDNRTRVLIPTPKFQSLVKKWNKKIASCFASETDTHTFQG